jgi:hypothetical protein
VLHPVPLSAVACTLDWLQLKKNYRKRRQRITRSTGHIKRKVAAESNVS